MTNLVDELQEDEYLQDGMIYCKKCGGKRLFVNDDFNISVRTMCKCQKEEYERKRFELKQNQKLVERRRNSLIPTRYKNATFETCSTTDNLSFCNAYKRCKAYSSHLEECLTRGLGLYIYGAKGTGKSHLSVCIANEIINQGYNAIFTNFFDITKAIKKTFNSNADDTESDLVDRIASIDFLILDDLGTETLSRNGEDTWIQEKIYDVLNKRYNNMKPTIFTSNHSLAELVNERGLLDKTADRILEMSNAIVKIEGDSYRRKIRQVDVPF